MAELTGHLGLHLSAEWARGAGIVAPEIAATWCQFAVTLKGRTVTLVDSDAPLRRSLYVSAYPLAEWIAFNWWRLQYDVRPSISPLSAWSWGNVVGTPWLTSHNFRGAGGGMPWPDLTIVPEGDVTRVVWRSGMALSNHSLRYVGSGEEYLPAGTVTRALGTFVDDVVERLREVGVTSALQDEWAAIHASTDEDVEFNEAIARLGLDPYTVDSETESAVITASEVMDSALLAEYLDSAIPERLQTAMAWWRDARSHAVHRTTSVGLRRVLETASTVDLPGARAYELGYERARRARAALGLDIRQPVAMEDLVAHISYSKPSGGLEGLSIVVPGESCSLVLPTDRLTRASESFAQARSLGLALQGERHEYILDPTSTRSARQSRAFAAELLAPAAGIAEHLRDAQTATDQVFASIAAHYGTTTQLVNHQYENQLVSP